MMDLGLLLRSPVNAREFVAPRTATADSGDRGADEIVIATLFQTSTHFDMELTSFPCPK